MTKVCLSRETLSCAAAVRDWNIHLSFSVGQVLWVIGGLDEPRDLHGRLHLGLSLALLLQLKFFQVQLLAVPGKLL